MTDSPSLRDMQRWMQSALIHPHRVQKHEVASRLARSNRLSASERLAIYQRSYISRLCACLAEQFPASRKALGTELFDKFARVFLAQEPSDSYTLHELGRRFPLFLEDTRPDADSDDADQEIWVNFMIDLARYERSLFVLFDAPGHEGKSWPTSATPDEALVLQPCFGLGAYRFPVAHYYHNIADQTEAHIPQPTETYIAISRYNYLTSTLPITRLHYEFLQSMQKTQSVDHSLDYIAKRMDISTDQIRESWKTEIRERWIEQNFFVDRNTIDSR